MMPTKITINNVPDSYGDTGILEEMCRYEDSVLCEGCSRKTDCLNSGEVSIDYNEMIQNSGFTFTMRDVLIRYLFYNAD